MIQSTFWGSQKFSRLTWRLTTRCNKSFVHTKRIVWTQWFWHLGMFWIHPLTFAHEGFGCNFWVIVFVWGAGGLLFLLNFPCHIETPIMWCKKLCLLVYSEDLACQSNKSSETKTAFAGGLRISRAENQDGWESSWFRLWRMSRKRILFERS